MLVLIKVRHHCSTTINVITDGTIAELISAVPSHNPTFVSRNFTDAEAAYCRAQPSPSSSFAARWAGKEAVFKSLGVKSKGAAASLRDIEILNDSESGVPFVTLHGDAKVKAHERGVKKVLISLSHSEVSPQFPTFMYFMCSMPSFLDYCDRLCSGIQIILKLP